MASTEFTVRIVLTTDWKWIRDQNREMDDRVHIISARLDALKDHCRLNNARLAERTELVKVGEPASKQTISNIRRRNGRTEFGEALAIAHALTPETSDPLYLLDWLVDPTATLSGPTKSEELPTLSTSDQVTAYYRRHEVWLGATQALTAAATQSPGPLPPVTLPDGSVIQTYLIKGEDFPQRGTES